MNLPGINRFRIVNFKYDDNRKYIADEIFDIVGQHSLINLENGGGKSAMLQLALQVMLPNTRLGSRRMNDYFTMNSGTVHILMEWILDTTGAGRQFLLSGFCCRKGQNGLDYFTYTHPHTGQDDYNIKKIPVVNKNREVSGYYEFYRYMQSLSRESRLRFNLFRQNDQKKYRKQLETYNLFEEEFRAIRTINQSEGGIDKFFEKARTSRQVVERLIIPSIPSGSRDSGVLVSTFKKHMDNLKTIPELQSRIKNYDDFCDRAEVFISEVKKYGRLYERHKEIANNIFSLYNLIGIAEKFCKKESEEYENKYREALNNYNNLMYMRDSFKYTKIKKDSELILDKISSLNKQTDSLKLKMNKLKLDIDNSKSANDWLALKENRLKLLERQEEIKTVRMEKKKDDNEYRRILFTLGNVYTDKINELNEKIKKAIRMQKEIQFEESELKNEKNELNIQRNQAEKKCYHSGEKIKEKNNELKKLMTKIEGEYSVFLEPSKHIEYLEDVIRQLEHDKNDTVELTEEMKGQETIIDTKIEREKDKKRRYASEKDVLEEKIEIISIKKSNLENKLKNYEINTPVYEKTTILKLGSIIKAQRLEYNSILGRKLTLERRQLAFKGSKSYIPDLAIRKVTDLLNDNDIHAIPGATWISKQSNEIRRKLMDINPYLPFSVIISEKDINVLKPFSKDIYDCIEGYPVWILTGNGKVIKYPDENIETAGSDFADRLFDKRIYLLNTEAKELTVNPKAWDKYRQELEYKIENLQSELSQKQSELSKAEKLLSDIKIFTHEFSRPIVENMKEKLSEAKEFYKSSELQIAKFKQELEKLKTEIQNKNKILDENKKKSSHVMEQKGFMEEHIKLTNEKKEYENENKEQNKIIEELGIKLERLNIKISEKEENSRQLENTIKIYEDNKKEFQVKLSETSYVIDGEYEKIDGSMEELEAKKSTLEKNLENVNIELLEELIHGIKMKIEELENSIRDRNTDHTWLKTVQNPVSIREIENLEEKFNQITKSHNELIGEIRQNENKQNEISGSLKSEKARIIDIYQKDPYIFDTVSNNDKQKLNEDLKKTQKTIDRFKAKLDGINSRIYKLEKISERIFDFIESNEIKKFCTDSVIGEFKTEDGVINQWDIVSKKDDDIKVFYNTAREKFSESREKLEKGKKHIEEEYQNLYSNRDWSVNQNIKGLVSRVGDTDIYNYDVIQKVFEDVFKSVNNLKKAAELQLKNLNKDRREIILRCVRRARNVYDEVKSVDKFSKIPVGEKKQRAVKIDIPLMHDEMAENMMGQYLDSCIEELSKKRSEQNFDPAKIEDEIRKKIKPTSLMDAVAPLNSFRIKVLKPGHNMQTSRYIEWEKIISWSGGEKLAGFFAMFIAIISYLRYKRTQWNESAKVIWIDNPFGQANAGYLLDYIFELAKTTKTQMICLTGLQETTIYEKFNVVYSLVHRMLNAGSSVIRSQNVKSVTGMDSGMYEVNHTQMGLF